MILCQKKKKKLVAGYIRAIGLVLLEVASDSSQLYRSTRSNVLPWLGFCCVWAGIGSVKLKSLIWGNLVLSIWGFECSFLSGKC